MTLSKNSGPDRDHNQKGHVTNACLSFIKAQGNLEQRKEIKDRLKRLCTELSIAWETLCQWFRETVRRFETTRRAELESQPLFRLLEGNDAS